MKAESLGRSIKAPKLAPPCESSFSSNSSCLPLSAQSPIFVLPPAKYNVSGGSTSFELAIFGSVSSVVWHKGLS